MKVLLSAYACEPGKGSEPGVGWNWAKGLASRVSLCVLTRESNRAAIEGSIRTLSEDDPLHKVEFLYHDLAKPFLWAKKRGILPTMAYYILWQLSAARRFSATADRMDVVHHLTFCTLLCPGFWKTGRTPFLAGPIGAPLVNPHYLPLFGSQAWRQELRDRMMRHFDRLPWLRKRLRSAAGLVPANSETRDLMLSRGLPVLPVMLDTGAPEAEVSQKATPERNRIRLIYAGQLERRKGIEIAMRALQKVSQEHEIDWCFDLFGKGPDEPRLRSLAETLGISGRVVFRGSVARDELMRRFSTADAFLFTSVRDTSGGVNLEAMVHGLPIICIAHQGVGDITSDSCAERIPPGTVPETITAIADAVIRLARDPERLQTLGSNAAIRAAGEFSWSAKFDRMVAHYQHALVAR